MEFAHSVVEQVGILRTACRDDVDRESFRGIDIAQSGIRIHGVQVERIKHRPMDLDNLKPLGTKHYVRGGPTSSSQHSPLRCTVSHIESQNMRPVILVQTERGLAGRK